MEFSGKSLIGVSLSSGSGEEPPPPPDVRKRPIAPNEKINFDLKPFLPNALIKQIIPPPAQDHWNQPVSRRHWHGER